MLEDLRIPTTQPSGMSGHLRALPGMQVSAPTLSHKVIAKLEKPEAVDDLEAVVPAFDAIMVVRGDLGVELPLEQVPLVQKRAIQLARDNAKPVIVVAGTPLPARSARPTPSTPIGSASATTDPTGRQRNPCRRRPGRDRRHRMLGLAALLRRR